MNVERNLLLGTITVILVIAPLGVVFAGENRRMARETEAQQGEAIARGARLYDDYCAGCHGQRGEGGMAGLAPPLNVEDLWAGRDEIAFYGTLHDYIALNIEAGHPSQRMPSWADQYGGPLRNDQVEDLTQFILNWQGQQPAGVRGPAPTPGAAATGEQIFATNCASCHGPDASGTDLGPSLLTDELAAKDDDFFRETIANGRPGTSMPPWSGVLSPEQIEKVIAYLRELQGE